MSFCNDFSLVWTVELGVTRMEEQWRGPCSSKLFKILPRKSGKVTNGHNQEAGTLTSNFLALLSHEFICILIRSGKGSEERENFVLQ